MRTFPSGATRDSDEHKIDFEAALSPLVLQAYGEYMRSKRKMADGSVRDADNWQKGMPLSAFIKSGIRHTMDWWLIHRGFKGAETLLVETLCAILFNVSGYLHEYLKARLPKTAPTVRTDLSFKNEIISSDRVVEGRVTPGA